MHNKSAKFAVFIFLGTLGRCFSADMSVQLSTNDGSTKYSIQNSLALEVASVDSLGNATFHTINGTINPNQINAGSLAGTVIASSIAVNAVQDASIVAVSAGKLTGNLPALNGSALTNLTGANVVGNIPGNAASIIGSISPNQINAGSLAGTVIASSIAISAVQDASIVAVSAAKLTGNLPALNGSALTNLTGANVVGNIPGNAASIIGSISPNQINAGSLAGTVIASSIAISAVQDASIVAVSAAKLSGTVSNASLDSSSVTKQGNTFNAANQLVQLDTSGNLPLPSGAHITVGSLRGTIVPSGTLILTTSTCPSGFTEYTGAGGFDLVGVPSGGTVGGTVGTAMTDLQNSSHSHSITVTTAMDGTAVAGTATVVTGVTSPTGTVTRGSIAPYFQIRLCSVP